MSERTYQIPVLHLDWEPWFAWFPVKARVWPDKFRWVWLKRIERRHVWFVFWTTEYRIETRITHDPR